MNMGFTTKKCGISVSFYRKHAFVYKTEGKHLDFASKLIFLKIPKNLCTGPLHLLLLLVGFRSSKVFVNFVA
jgi:hypothetical protein